jgi:hypothetical protein
VGVVINPESSLGIEMAKWEQTPADRDPVKHRYPFMLYKAHEQQGKATISDPDDAAFSQRCQFVVKNEQEHLMARGQGWFDSPQAAIDAYEAQQVAYADEAANTAYKVARMSEKAQREYKDASDATHAHVVDVQPTKRRRGPNKPKPVTIAQE